MTSQEFFDKMKGFLQNEKPFVVYRKPASSEETNFSVEGFFQQDDSLHTIESFEESGFVFAPFQSENKPILIPLEKVEKISVDVRLPESLEVSKHNIPGDEAAKTRHLKLVTKTVDVIKNKDFQKVVLSRKIEIPLKKNPVAIFQRLLKFYPTAFVYCWFHPKVGLWLGATPETLVKISGQTLKTMAVAGTKEYIENQEPKWTSKEIEEQQIVTDSIENSLNAKVNHLSISETENYRAGNLWHLKTEISGRLDRQKSLKEILEDLHPTPAVCGLPKDRAKQFILENENYNREFYTGFLGELNLKEKKIRGANHRNVENQAYSRIRRKTELFVNLRCMQIKNQTGSLYVGGGIVKDSQPESEWQETVNKSETMMKAL